MVVIGLGSPYLSDDAIGPRIIRELGRDNTMQHVGVRFSEMHAGGMLLLEEMTDARVAVIVDALVDPDRTPGEVIVAGIHGASHNASCSHDCTLPEAIAMGRSLGMHFPSDDQITLVAIVAGDVSTFSETLSPDVEAAIPEACAVIRRLIVSHTRIPESA